MNSTRELILDAYSRIEECYTNRKEPDVIYTGFSDIDNIFGGLRKSELTLIAGRESSDNTSFVLNLAYNTAISQDSTTLFISLQNNAKYILGKYICIGAEINHRDYLHNRLKRTNSLKLKAFADTNQKTLEDNIVAIYSHNFLVSDMDKIITNFSKINPNGIVIIDSFEQIKIMNYQHSYEEYAENTRQLKNISRNANIPVLLLCNTKQRKNLYPKLDDLSNYDTLVQDCDNVCFIYNEILDEGTISNERKLIVEKHRHGPDMNSDFIFNDATNKFKEQSYIDWR